MSRGRFLRTLRSGVVLLLVAACAPPPPPQLTPEPLAQSERVFLPEPVAALGLPADARLTDLHRRLVAGESPQGIAREVTASGVSPGSDAELLLLAEAELVGGDSRSALGRIARLTPGARGLAPVVLFEARALELTGNVIESYAQLRRIAAVDPVAARHLGELEPAALVGQRRRVQEALARGHVDDARREQATLELWRPRERETRQLAVEVAAASGDAQAERTALLDLGGSEPLTRLQELRLAALDLELGETGAALERLERLVAADPRDVEARDALSGARFHWRLTHSPREVRAAAVSPQLTRADLARLVYWLVPGVRAARGGTARIASDLTGHPAREEIIRVVNLGLLSIDETVHTFQPDRPARRAEAMGAVLRAIAGEAPGSSCAPALPDAASWEEVCVAAATCGWIGEVAECLPGGPVSGPEVSGWIRRAARDDE